MAISKVKLPDNSSQELHDYRISGVDSTPTSGSGNVITSGGTYTALAGKQDTISDLATIRSGALAGATAYQKPSTGIPASDLAAGVIPAVTPPEVYVAEFGDTSYDTIDDVIFDGKLPICYYNDRQYVLSYNEGQTPAWVFTSITETSNLYYLRCPQYGTQEYDTYPNDYGWNAGSVALALRSSLNAKENTSNKVTSLSPSSTDTQYPSAKATYDNIHPEVVTLQPAGGMAPNIVYELGTLSGNTTFTLASPADADIANHYFWTFATPSTAPTITWPAGITSWYGGNAPTISASKHYEVSVLDGVAICMEV